MEPKSPTSRRPCVSRWLANTFLAIAAFSAFTPPEAQGTVLYTVTWEDSPDGALEGGAEPDRPVELDPGIAATISSAANWVGPSLPTGRFVRCVEEQPADQNAAALTFDRGISVSEGLAAVTMTLLFESPDFYEIGFRAGRAADPLGPNAHTLVDVWLMPDGRIRWVSDSDGGWSDATYAIGKPIQFEARFDFEAHSASISVEGRPLTAKAISINPSYPLGRTRVGFGHSSPAVGVFQLDDFRFSSTPAVACDTTVTDTADSGAGSLREAIRCANERPGRDTIRFAIQGSGPHVIAPSTPLPAVTDSVVIDGWTQPGSRRNSTATGGLDAVVAIVLDGSEVGETGDGLVLEADGCDVMGLEIRAFPQAGIRLLGSSSRVLGCGLGSPAEIRAPNQHGIVIMGGENQVGGPDPADRCLVPGNVYSGIWIEGSGNTVEGCLVGLSRNGLAQNPNGTPQGNGAGVFVAAGSSNRVLRSVVSGNFQSNVLIGKGVGHSVQECLIGLDATGSGGLPSPAYYGVVLQAARATRILGSTISGNGGGITVAGPASGTVVQGNKIGVNAHGLPAPNERWGVLLESGSQGTTIGGYGPAEANEISYNGAEGVLVAGDSTGNTVTGNAIQANGGLGIDLTNEAGADRGDGFDPRDPLDADDGPNRRLNAPRLSAASFDATWITIDGTLENAPSSVITLEFFANKQAHRSGSGEGEFFVGEARLVTDTLGKAFFTATLSAAILAKLGPNPGLYWTASATDADGNTSEFSNPVWSDAPLPFDCLRFDSELAGSRTSPWNVGSLRVEGDGLRIAENPPAGLGLYVGDRVQMTLPSPCPRVLLEVANFAQLEITALDETGTNVVARGLAPENRVSQILVGPQVSSLTFYAPANEASILSLCCLGANPPKPRIASVARREGSVTLDLVGLARGRTVRIERAEKLGRPWVVVGTLVATGETARWTERGAHEQAYYRVAVL